MYFVVLSKACAKSIDFPNPHFLAQNYHLTDIISRNFYEYTIYEDVRYFRGGANVGQ
jgi:hypothetical protein